MAQVRGALLSDEASGLFGKGLIFSKVIRKNTVKFNTPRKLSTSPSQYVIRMYFGWIISDWRICSQSIIDFYTEKAKYLPLLPVNAFYKDFFSWTYDPVYNDSHYGTGRYGSP